MSYEPPFPTPEPALETVQRCGRACYARFLGTREELTITRYAWWVSSLQRVMLFGAEMQAARIFHDTEAHLRTSQDASGYLIEIDVRALHTPSAERDARRREHQQEKRLRALRAWPEEETFL